MAAGAVAYVQKGAGKTARLVPDLLAAAGLLETTVTTLQPRSHRADLPATAASAGLARQFAREVLGSEGDDVLDTVQLLVSELVTNAVVHARSAPTVAIHLFDDHVHVEVLDDRSDEARREDADADAESGRGVALVDALSERWGSLTVESGKIVWFDVGRAPLPPDLRARTGLRCRQRRTARARAGAASRRVWARKSWADGSSRRSSDHASPSSRVAEESSSRMTRTAPVGRSWPSRGRDDGDAEPRCDETADDLEVVALEGDPRLEAGLGAQPVGERPQRPRGLEHHERPRRPPPRAAPNDAAPGGARSAPPTTGSGVKSGSQAMPSRLGRSEVISRS